MKRQNATPSRTVVTSFNPKTTAAKQQHGQQEDYFEDGDWVLCVASGPEWISCALSNGELQVYDRERLHQVQTWHSQENDQGGGGLITELHYDDNTPNSIYATSTDGTLTLFDIRQRNAAYQWKLPRAPEEEALSVSVGFGGNIAAVGSSKAKIHFFDLRQNRALLGTYNQNHTGEVTRVRFQRVPTLGGPSGSATATPVLVSAGEDGLACVYDTSQPSEEAALVNILAVQSPVREIDFFGPQSEAIYCLTGSESLLLYHKDDAICRKNFGVGLRNDLSQLVANNSSDGHSFPIEYLVDCQWDRNQQQLMMLAGSAKGDAGVFAVHEGGISWKQSLCGGHRGVLRAWERLSTTSSDMIVTVGEDARMCEWGLGATSSERSSPQLGQQPTSNTTAPTIVWPKRRSYARAGGGKVRRPRSRLAASPY